MALLDDKKRQLLEEAYTSQAALDDPARFMDELRKFNKKYDNPQDQRFLATLTTSLLNKLAEKDEESHTAAVMLAVTHYHPYGDDKPYPNGHARAAASFLEKTIKAILEKDTKDARENAFALAEQIVNPKGGDDPIFLLGRSLMDDIISQTLNVSETENILQAADFCVRKKVFFPYDSKVDEYERVIFRNSLIINDFDALKTAYQIAVIPEQGDYPRYKFAQQDEQRDDMPGFCDLLQKLTAVGTMESLKMVHEAVPTIIKTSSHYLYDNGKYGNASQIMRSMLDKLSDIDEEESVQFMNRVVDRLESYTHHMRESRYWVDDMKESADLSEKMLLVQSGLLADKQIELGHFEQAVKLNKQQYDLLPIANISVTEEGEEGSQLLFAPPADSQKTHVKRLQRITQGLRDGHFKIRPLSDIMDTVWNTSIVPRKSDRNVDMSLFKAEYLEILSNISQALLKVHRNDLTADNDCAEDARSYFFKSAELAIGLINMPEKKFIEEKKDVVASVNPLDLLDLIIPVDLSPIVEVEPLPQKLSLKDRFLKMARSLTGKSEPVVDVQVQQPETVMITDVKVKPEVVVSSEDEPADVPAIDYYAPVLNNLAVLMNATYEKYGRLIEKNKTPVSTEEKNAVKIIKKTASMHYNLTHIGTPERSVSIEMMKKSGQGHLITEQQSEKDFDDFLSNLQNLGFQSGSSAPSNNFKPQ